MTGKVAKRRLLHKIVWKKHNGTNRMYCQNKIIHVVEEGDSLYKLARQYRTTVTELILGNPGVNPYNLQTGMQLNVCPGEEFKEPENQESNRPQGGRPQITIIRPTTPGGSTRRRPRRARHVRRPREKIRVRCSREMLEIRERRSRSAWDMPSSGTQCGWRGWLISTGRACT